MKQGRQFTGHTNTNSHPPNFTSKPVIRIQNTFKSRGNGVLEIVRQGRRGPPMLAGRPHGNVATSIDESCDMILC